MNIQSFVKIYIKYDLALNQLHDIVHLNAGEGSLVKEIELLSCNNSKNNGGQGQQQRPSKDAT